MSRAQKIAVLERLLERVRSRARWPGGAPVAETEAVGRVSSELEPPGAGTNAAVAPAMDGAEVDSLDLSTWPPPPDLTDTTAVELDIPVELEPLESSGDDSSTSVDRSPASLDTTLPARESAERLMVAEGAAVEPAPEVTLAAIEAAGTGSLPDETDVDILEPLGLRDADSHRSPLHLEVAPAEDEPGEPEPVSSRRPVAPVEELAQMAFGAEPFRPPRHTPPPESGRLPSPPDEPFDPDVTGVRVAPAHEAEPPAEPAFEPVAVRPSLAEALEPIAEVVAPARSLTPSTFLGWLDESLSL